MAILAVDFDGTIQFRDGSANVPLLRQLVGRQRVGDIIILWTCRSGSRLNEAVRFCMKHGLRPNYVNENAPETVRRPELKEIFQNDTRKVYADLYLDDKGVCIHDDHAAGLA